MYILTINDIKEWLIENRNDFQKLKAQEFPPVGNEMYSMYGHLKDFIEIKIYHISFCTTYQVD